MDMQKTSVARYMGPAPERTTTPKGSLVCLDTLKALTTTFAIEPRIIEVTKGVYNYVGSSISSRTMIDAPDGLIIFDTGDDIEDGEKALAAFREICDRPIKAIIYSHNHYAHGTKPFLKDQKDVMIIGHHDVNKHLREVSTGFATGGEFPEAIGALTSRYLSQFGAQLPASGPDSGFAATIPMDVEKGAVPATHLVTDGQKLNVAGLEIQFFTDYFSDSEDTVTAWVPELQLALNNFLWPALFNFYTLRGDVFRNPASWRDGLKVLRDLGAEHIVNTHALPVSGKDNVRQTLERYMDSISFMIDQTLRGINRGLGPNQLREFVRLPKVLADHPHNCEIYSEFNFFPPHLYHHIFGWYDGNPANIAKLPQEEEARRIIKGFGGAEEVSRQAREALKKSEALWAVQLADYLFKIDPETHKTLRADTLREMAYRSSGTILRHFCLTEALIVEGKIERQTNVLPSVENILAADTGHHISFQRIRLDPILAGDSSLAVQINITDRDESFVLSLRNGICNFSTADGFGSEPDATLSVTMQDWAEFYVGQIDIEDLLKKNTNAASNQSIISNFFSMFDKPWIRHPE